MPPFGGERRDTRTTSRVARLLFYMAIFAAFTIHNVMKLNGPAQG